MAVVIISGKMRKHLFGHFTVLIFFHCRYPTIIMFLIVNMLENSNKWLSKQGASVLRQLQPNKYHTAG